MKKRRKKLMVVIPLVVICGTAAGTAGYFKLSHTGVEQSDGAKVQSAEAKKGTLSQTIVGTGNLELADGEDQDIPSGLTVSEVRVESGDEVKEGDVLAVVDENSILDAMEQVQEEITQLDESIQEYQDSDRENTVTASVAGRVKKINVSSGSDLSDVMVSEGALMLLSLDGKMAVSLEGVSGVNVDDAVTVVLSSGTQVSGTVDSVSDDGCTVTVTDNGTVCGDTVTVLDGSGNTLGSGTLTIHQPLAVTGTSGTVSAVNVSENDSVSEGTTLLTLKDDANNTEYQELLAKREARAATLQKLLELKADPEIKAETSGTVQDVNVSEGSAAAESSSGGSTSTNSTNSSGSTKTVSQMSWKVSDGNVGTGSSGNYLSNGGSGINLVACSSVEDSVSENSLDESFEDGSGSEDPEEPVQDETPEDTSATVLQFVVTTEGTGSASSLVIQAPATGGTPVTSVNAADGTYTGTVSWNPQDNNFQEKTVYQAEISLTAADGYRFRTDSISGITLGTVSGISVSQDGKTMTFQLTFPETAASSEKEDSDKEKDSKDNSSEKDEDQLTDGEGESGSSQNSSGENDSAKTSGTEQGGASVSEGNGSSSQNSMGDSATGQSQDSNGTAQTSDDQTEETSETSKTELSQSEYSTDVTAFTIAPDDRMILNVSVDELDINSVETGQEALVTFDAIEDKEFTGEVTEIGNTASVNGGVAKYTVSVSVPKDDQMKQGMNASATITVESRENVITIPVSALQEKGNKTFVYTEKDESGNLSGETEVTTGLSDGTTVEITDGLSEGDTVYYNKAGSGENTNSNGSGMPGDMNDSGNMGSGGMGGDSQNGGPGGGPGGNGDSGGNGGGTPPNM